ncbi:DUF389 domain-containing protein [Agromyces aurantiacus]|uniref:DUF389 domain-containing protein n=1 Tax=Agromyces aurantiacus TaxID=165814 RepID=A0ABV9R0C3_9MICO|nr:DUF389 domain-containing protein [Agromyces aurantiacus]MBM7505878.1 putative hydrophobic protein (TIGR00271 family) [Agromyces aurantiacus]
MSQSPSPSEPPSEPLPPSYPPPPSDALNTIEHMRESVFFEQPHRRRKLQRFWMLLPLSAVIAAAGVVADSTATVIGAMIVAPMMLPIQGTMLATVLGDRRNLTRSVLMMLAGAGAAILIGWLVGAIVASPVTEESNTQVAARATPGLIDLLAALATGAVGSIALVRKDISDTLPGVAIAISLVPPLVVVGIAAESGDWGSSLGSLLLFAANVAAILGTGVVIMTIYRVARWGGVLAAAGSTPVPGVKTVNRRRSNIAIAGMLVLVAIPLGLSTLVTRTLNSEQAAITRAADDWAGDRDLDVVSVEYVSALTYLVRVTGGDAAPDVAPLADRLESAGVDPSNVEVQWIPSVRVNAGD